MLVVVRLLSETLSVPRRSWRRRRISGVEFRADANSFRASCRITRTGEARWRHLLACHRRPLDRWRPQSLKSKPVELHQVTQALRPLDVQDANLNDSNLRATRQHWTPVGAARGVQLPASSDELSARTFSRLRLKVFGQICSEFEMNTQNESRHKDNSHIGHSIGFLIFNKCLCRPARLLSK